MTHGTEYGNSRRSSDISAYNLVTQIIDPCTTRSYYGKPVKSVGNPSKDKTGVYNTDPVTVAIYAEKHGLLTLLAGNSGTQETSQDPETTYPLR
jgi:hypothetical protein